MPVAIPFGKYKGQPLSEIPDDYLAWCFGIAQAWLKAWIADEMRARGLLELLAIPCSYCDGVAEGWCVRCRAPACFRHIRQAGPETEYCIDHWDHWQDAGERGRVRMPSERVVQYAEAHPEEAQEHFARVRKRAERRAAHQATTTGTAI